MAKPSAVIPEWAQTANFGSTVYPAKILSTDPSAAPSMATFIAAVAVVTGVAAPIDFGEILHPNAGAGTPWSTTANKESTGLAAFANLGFEPSLPLKAESWNQWLANMWEYVDWLRLASSTADLDDHVVQTDVTGATALAKILAGGTALADSAAIFTSNSAGACVTIADTVGSFALSVTSGSTLAGLRTTQTGTGAAIEAILSGGSATGTALKGDAGSVGAFGVDGDGGTTGVGVRGTGGSSSGAGVQGDSSHSASPGVVGTNSNAFGTAVSGTTAASADVTAVAVRGTTGTGNAVAVKADSSSGDGYALLAFAKTASPVSAALRIVPQTTDPSARANGDFWSIDEGTNDRWMKWSRGSIARYLWDGLHPRFEDVLIEGSDGSTGVGALGEAVASTGVTTRTGGDVIITVRCGVSMTGSAPGSVTYTIESADDSGFSTNKVTHESSALTVPDFTNGTTEQQHQIFVQQKITPTNGPERFYRMTLGASGGDNCFFWQPSIRVEGEFV